MDSASPNALANANDEAGTARAKRRYSRNPLGKDLSATHYTEPQLAVEFGVSLRTVQKWRVAGEVPPFSWVNKRGPRWYAKADVAKWLADRYPCRTGPALRAQPRGTRCPVGSATALARCG